MGAIQDNIPKHVIIFTVLLICIGSVHSSRQCFSRMTSIGYTEPHGDISIKYGDPLNILCVINDDAAAKYKGNASQYMYFQKDNTVLSKEMITIVNSTTISLHIENPAKTVRDAYHCYIRGPKNKTFICYNFVFVGVPPQPVTDFQCTSYNKDNLTCNWTAPENFVQTNYSLAYYDRPYNASGAEPFYCPKIEGKRRGNVMEKSCTWSVSTYPIYRQSVRDYYFSLNMSNILGHRVMPSVYFNHFENVRPAPPEKFVVLSTTWNSINISFQVPTTLQFFENGLIYQVLYQCVYGEKKWVIDGNHSIPKGHREVYYTLANLKYAHAYYDLRVQLGPAKANPLRHDLWSDYAKLTNITASKIPDGPPRTNIGSFEHLSYSNDSKRNIKIYWSEISDEYQNGKDFQYVVVKVEDTHVDKRSTTENFMVFNNLSPDKSYLFKIWAQNDIGLSRDYSIIRVPKQSDCPHRPTGFIKEELEGGLYNLMWKRPDVEDQIIRNYTLFWCLEKNSNPCNGNFNWTVVPGDLTTYKQKVLSNRTLQFAISTNTDLGSSGMLWAACSNLPNQYSANKATGNILFGLSNLDSDSVMITWSLGCQDRSITGFVVHYCMISLTNDACKENETSQVVSSEHSSLLVRNLTPYTTYKFQMSVVINDSTISLPSQLKRLTTTLEAAPKTPPTHLKITGLTNTTITLTWKPPLITNGIIKYYEINFNNETLKINPQNASIYNVTLKNLKSYQKYDIKIQACTVSCSSYSKSVSATTNIGYPSQIQKPTIDQNATHTVVTWNSPDLPSGRNDYYEVQLKKKYDNKNFTTIYNTSSPMWSMFLCGEDKKYNSFFVSVRAVNLDGDKNFTGEWSAEIESYCRTPSNFIIYVVVTAVILFIFLMIYFTKWLYIRFKTMQNVEFKLPKGLAETVTDITLVPWNLEKNSNDTEHLAGQPNDKERLLVKRSNSNINHQTVESSGCSSAHDSITGSVDSAESISSSNSDSGTEQPTTPPVDDLNDPSHNSSLRQRNIRPTFIKTTYVSLPLDSACTSKMPSKNYCSLGDSTVASEGSPYVSLPLVPDKGGLEPSKDSPPYVLTGDIVKTVNPGYVPYKAAEKRCPSYVMASNKDLLTETLDDQVSGIPMVPSSNSNPYVKVAGNLKADILTVGPQGWQPPVVIPTNKGGYVTIGDSTSNPSFMSQRHFDSKALKED